MTLTVTDLFSGAGGSSLGATGVPGVELRMAANHWPLAVETHSLGFPNADHDCADISQVDPRRYPWTDILLASPECTHHSQARSKKHVANLFDPNGDMSAERSRATMWDVPRFAEAMQLKGHAYKAVIVENVQEIMRWLPIDGWFTAMDSLGYRHQIVSMNSMIAWPTPQSRDRWYCVFTLRKNPKPDMGFRPPSYCPKCDVVTEAVQVFKRHDRQWGKYKQQYTYRCQSCSGEVFPFVYPAGSAIDWSLPCPRIGDRVKPLAAATRRRVELGVRRYWGVPVVVQRYGHTFERKDYARAWPVTNPLPSLMTEVMHGLVLPLHHGSDENRQPRSTSLPFPTQTGRAEQALVMANRNNNSAHLAWSEPIATITTAPANQMLIVPLRNHGVAVDGDSEPMGTITAGGNHHALVVKNYGAVKDAGPMSLPPTSPLGTVTGVDHHSLVTLPFTTDYHGNGGANAVTNPLGTVDTRDRHALVMPEVDVDDCGLRMFQPHEVGNGMAFPASYVVLGSKRDQVRQYGNAVTPPAMGKLMERVVESLA